MHIDLIQYLDTLTILEVNDYLSGKSDVDSEFDSVTGSINDLALEF